MISRSDPSIFRPKRIGLIGFDQVTALHLLNSVDTFAAAVLHDGYGGRIPCYEVCIIGVCSGRFQAECGLTFRAQLDLNTAPTLDAIIVAGGRGILNPAVSGEITAWLLERANETHRIGTIATGIYPLAETGFLDGREVTTHWEFAQDVARRFPRLRLDHKKALVQDGPYYTCAGPNADTTLSLSMIQEDYGPEVARSVARELVLQLTKRQESFSDSVQCNGHPIDRFAELVAWILRNLHSDLSVKALARRACMSPGHFSKSFKSVFGAPPTDFVKNLRLNEARRRLAKRQKILRAVAASVGFSNTAAFQRAFERRFGTRPSTYFERKQTKELAAECSAPVINIADSD